MPHRSSSNPTTLTPRLRNYCEHPTGDTVDGYLPPTCSGRDSAEQYENAGCHKEGRTSPHLLFAVDSKTSVSSGPRRSILKNAEDKQPVNLSSRPFVITPNRSDACFSRKDDECSRPATKNFRETGKQKRLDLHFYAGDVAGHPYQPYRDRLKTQEKADSFNIQKFALLPKRKVCNSRHFSKEKSSLTEVTMKAHIVPPWKRQFGKVYYEGHTPPLAPVPEPPVDPVEELLKELIRRGDHADFRPPQLTKLFGDADGPNLWSRSRGTKMLYALKMLHLEETDGKFWVEKIDEDDEMKRGIRGAALKNLGGGDSEDERPLPRPTPTTPAAENNDVSSPGWNASRRSSPMEKGNKSLTSSPATADHNVNNVNKGAEKRSLIRKKRKNVLKPKKNMVNPV